MLNDLEIDARAKFYNEHGTHVFALGEVLFRDGARDDGRLSPPPDDEFEACQVIERYWLLVAQAAEEEFIAFKMYLGGSGKRKDEWAKLFTREEQLAKLKCLLTNAKRKRSRYLRAKRERTKATPFWMVERECVEAEDSERTSDFLSRLDSIQL